MKESVSPDVTVSIYCLASGTSPRVIKNSLILFKRKIEKKIRNLWGILVKVAIVCTLTLQFYLYCLHEEAVMTQISVLEY